MAASTINLGRAENHRGSAASPPQKPACKALPPCPRPAPPTPHKNRPWWPPRCRHRRGAAQDPIGQDPAQDDARDRRRWHARDTTDPRGRLGAHRAGPGAPPRQLTAAASRSGELGLSTGADAPESGCRWCFCHFAPFVDDRDGPDEGAGLDLPPRQLGRCHGGRWRSGHGLWPDELSRSLVCVCLSL